MRRRKKDFDFLQMVADSDPEMAEIVEEMRRDEASGKLRYPPWRWDECHDWLDGWLYVYRRVHLSDDRHLCRDGERVRCVVQIGPDFNDKAVGWLERLAARLGPGVDLEELRLIGTRVTDDGVQRLQKLFPNAEIKKYSREDEEREPQIGYADD